MVRTRRSQSQSAKQERTLFGVPERFMKPRIVLLVVVTLLVLFGLLMIYSASSVTAMTNPDMGNNPFYFVTKQGIIALVGTVLAVGLAVLDYRKLCRAWPVLFGGTVAILALVLMPFAGTDALGATRWIAIGGFTIQPSEFAKISIIMMVAFLIQQYLVDGVIDRRRFIMTCVAVVVLPLGLILRQPDKGTTLIIVTSIIVMAFLAGFDMRLVMMLGAAGAVVLLFLATRDEYSRARFLIGLNPWADYNNTGYQLAQAQYAFGTGGLFGVGIGFSKQKYSYLPMAHNDFIFAVIGEETGYIGILCLFAAFALLAWAGYQIAKYAPDLTGRLIAAGFTSMFIFQALLNVGGVVGVLPLSGKPLPFISYGGSTLLSSLITVGVLMSISRRSALPQTEHDSRRRSWRFADEKDSELPEDFMEAYETPSLTTIGTPRSKPATLGSSFTMVDGGNTGRSPSRSSRERIDLGPSATDRLRGSSESRGTRGKGRDFRG